jgi:hypothetical protein
MMALEKRGMTMVRIHVVTRDTARRHAEELRKR